jgi:DNA-binding transcriptional MerR regulator
MTNLQHIARHQPRWSLDEFVQVANQFLPQFLPTQKAHTRVREEVTPRLIRYYTTQGMLDEPLKEGREARYIYRHLLQLLIVRRLLVEGYGATAIGDLAISKSNDQLEQLLEGGVQLTITMANPALAFLEKIKKRQSIPTPPVSSPPETMRSPSPSKLEGQPRSSASHWKRLEILPGLEIHVREDFAYPNSPQEQQNLLQYIAEKLLAVCSKRRSSK